MESEDYLPSKQARNWAMFCHLSALSGYIGVPFGNILGPLVLWLVKRDEDPFIDAQGKEALNFQISMIIYAVISGILIIAIVGIFLLLAVIVGGVILTIVAAVKSNDGYDYRYPLTIRFIK